ncbi:hypothetical protein KGP36_04025 [Patescibacteria group bacterium]|nr:hypothetical protein [Patescibacteria group bacterium]
MTAPAEGPWRKYQAATDPDSSASVEPAPAPAVQEPWTRYQIPPTTPTPAPQPASTDVPLSQVPGQAVQHVIPSAVKLGTGMLTALQHPIKTVEGLGSAAAGAVLKGLTPQAQQAIGEFVRNPGAIAHAISSANAIGGMYAQRYGNPQRVMNTIANDPMGFLADASTLLTGGEAVAGGAARVADVAGMARTAGATNALSTGLRVAGNVSNPMNALSLPASVIGHGLGYGYNMAAIGPKGMTYLRAVDERGPAVLTALQNVGAHQIVPGSLPTAAEAASPAAATRFSAMGDQAAQTLPDEYYQRLQDQNAARIAQVQQVGRTPADLQNARNLRQLASNFNYGVADTAVIPLDADFQALAQRPAIASAIREAQTIAANRNESLWDATTGALTGRGAHLIKTALDDAVTPNATTTNARNANAAIESARGDYLNWLEDRNPAYRTARNAHAIMSQPINQMEVGQYLEGQLTPALGEGTATQRATRYVGALDNAPTTIRRATNGAPRFQTLDQILTPVQLDQLNSVRDDLSRAKTTEQQVMAASGSGPNPARVGSDTIGGLKINLLNPIATVANRVFQIGAGRLNRAMSIQIATEMLNPELAANVLQRALGRQAVGQAIGHGAQAAGAVVTRAPAVYNVLADPQTSNALLR